MVQGGFSSRHGIFAQQKYAERAYRQIRKVFYDTHRLATGEKMGSTTVRGYVKSWRHRTKTEVSANTWEKYKSVSQQLLGYLGSRADAEMDAIKAREIAGFRDQMASRLTAGTTNLALRVVKMIFLSAFRDEMIASNPGPRVRGVKQSRKDSARRAFTFEELRRIYRQCHGEWKGIFLFGYHTGQRLMDIATLTWENIDLQRKELAFVSTKTNRFMVIPLVDPLVDYLAEEQVESDDPSEPLFPKSHAQIFRDSSPRVAALSNQFHKIMADAGLVEARSTKNRRKGQGTSESKSRAGRRKPSDVSFHSLRHTATSFMKNAGSSAPVVQDIIGHESEAVSRQYTHIEEDTKRRALSAMPDIRNVAKGGEER